MRILRRLFLLLLLSVTIATAIFFINSDVIVSTLESKIYEIGAYTVPVFIVVSIFYYVNKALVRTVKGMKKKKPSREEGPKI
jgi:O-antigen/teichoic acid export membrane protein